MSCKQRASLQLLVHLIFRKSSLHSYWLSFDIKPSKGLQLDLYGASWPPALLLMLATARGSQN